MRLWPCYVPHGARTHATREAPLDQGPPETDRARSRRTLCGLIAYRGGPALEWAFVPLLDRCARCSRIGDEAALAAELAAIRSGRCVLLKPGRVRSEPPPTPGGAPCR